MKRLLLTSAAAFLLALTGTAGAQTSNISTENKYCWGENVGWMNWADAGDPAGTQAARVDFTFLSGFVWCENVGWLNLGDGTPTNGAVYANANGTDFGVNIDAQTGNLSGMAWGENVGWINFAGGAIAGGASTAARISLAEPRRFLGYAWGENIGWVNLDHATHFVGINSGGGCDGDVNCDGNLDGFDVETMERAAGGDLTDYCLADPDFNHDGNLDGFDVESVAAVVGGAPCP